MFQYTSAKAALKRAAGCGASLWHTVGGATAAGGCILMYHRVANIGFRDPDLDDWNVPPRQFERQMAMLAECAEVVPLHAFPGQLSLGERGKPLVTLTFDDGYANFFSEALPVLRHYQLPATVFVVTSLVGENDPLPFDAWSRRHASSVPAETVRSLSWPEIEVCLDSGLVDIGSHSHRHLNAAECRSEELLEEAHRSRSILQRQLGDEQGRWYAFPYGSSRLGSVNKPYVDAVKSAGYDLAVSTNLGLAGPASNRFCFPRVEVHGVDNPIVLRAKACGAILPYYLLDRLRSNRNLS